jgi:hypothetical protein
MKRYAISSWWSARFVGIPYDLDKACGDPFEYAVGLRNGQIFYFEEAIIYGAWVRLKGVKSNSVPMPRDEDLQRFTFDRGIQIRLSEIAWVADAPYGS